MSSTTFFTLSQRVKEHMLLRYCIKNLSIGVAWGALFNLFWIFEYVTAWQFSGPLNADWANVEKVAMGILNFESKICRKV